MDTTTARTLTTDLLTLWATDPTVIVARLNRGTARTFTEATADRLISNSKARRNYRARLAQYQGNLCICCGLDLGIEGEGNEWELSHNVAAKVFGPEVRGGYFWGNLGTWHKSCNRDNGERTVTIGTGRDTDIQRPDLVFFGDTRDLPRLQG